MSTSLCTRTTAETDPYYIEESSTKIYQNLYNDENHSNARPQDYITGPLEIKGVNHAVEKALRDFEREGRKDRKALRYITNKKIVGISSQTGSLPLTRPATKYVVKKVTFGLSSVVHFEESDIVPKKSVGGPIRGKSILKRSSFNSPSTDYEKIGRRELQNAIARIYNLCDLPFTLFRKDDPLLSLELLARGVCNAFKSHEICWKKVGEEELLELKEKINNLETENETKERELNHFKQELYNDLNRLIPEEQVLKIPDISYGIVKTGIAKIEHISTKWKLRAASCENNDLREENEALREENAELRKGLLGQRDISELLVETKISEKKTIIRTRPINSRIKGVNDERSTVNELILKRLLKASQKSNETLAGEYKELKDLQGSLYEKVHSLKVFLGAMKQAFCNSISREKALERVNLKLISELEGYRFQNDQLKENSVASELELNIRIEQRKNEDARKFDQNQCVNSSTRRRNWGAANTIRSRGDMREDAVISPRKEVDDDEGIKGKLDQERYVSTRHRIMRTLTNRIHLSSKVNK